MTCRNFKVDKKTLKILRALPFLIRNKLMQSRACAMQLEKLRRARLGLRQN